MVSAVAQFDYSALAKQLDLPNAETVDDQIQALRECRAFQLVTLAARDPEWIPTATLMRLRASCMEEVRACESALTALGVGFDLPTEQESGES